MPRPSLAARARLVLPLLALALVALQPRPAASQSGGTGCEIQTSDAPGQIAFCETFDAPSPNRATRSGDLDPELWGVSRTNTSRVNLGQSQLNDFVPARLVGCGATQSVLPPGDVRICNGRVLEAVNDGGGQPIVALYPKQPFDFAGRTGTVAFDVSADSDGPHAAWPEFWITDTPVPAPSGNHPAQSPYARHSFGFAISSDDCGSGTGVEAVMVTRNYRFASLPFTRTGCVTRGSATGALNHFEVRLNTNRVEVWAGDAGSDILRLIAYADDLALSFTRGLVWLEHVAYNACKFGSDQCDHTFAWDNLAFDGPRTYRDLSFDVPDAKVPVAGGLRLGYSLPATLQVPGVFRRQTPTRAIVTFNWFPYTAFVPSFRLNGGPWHSTPWPFDAQTFAWRTIDVPVGVSEVRDGTNTIEFASGQAVLSNVNVILVAGAPVPEPTPAPNPAPPFGAVDTPTDDATGIEGAFAVSGWALDETGVTRVVLSRDPVAGEPAGTRVYVGDAVFVDGARPDVAAAFPTYPNATRAGWGYMLLTNMLPNQGNGTFRLWLHAVDGEGHETLLGTRRFTCANSSASRPFGTIDTPAQGQTVSGSAYRVFGWALAPQPGAIPTDGSTIWVFVDGVPVGRVVYDNYRSDIATLFPGYANTNGAVGYYVLDTTKLADGIHSIAWSITDDLGRAEGIGSRYFWVKNP